ncbi:MAG TPA: methyltransferase domain-containing protein [Vicinamibacterales bacterium]|nr:methyltransferase domain-containing protein [Vicinamibacterales bacterium]
MARYLYVAPNLGEVAVVENDRLADTSERHKIALGRPAAVVCLDPLGELQRRTDLHGAVVALDRGWPGWSHLQFAMRVLRTGRPAWLYWPQEEAVERLDAERAGSYLRHWILIAAYRGGQAVRRRVRGLGQSADPAPAMAARCLDALDDLASRATPVPLQPIAVPSRQQPFEGLGVYLRTDYWVQIESGGSYGHTSYVARELAASSREFVCLMSQRYALVDDFGLHQVVMPAAAASAHEYDLMAATWHYYPILKVAFEALRPGYVYERLCLGNFAGALLSRELNIPYIVEYNGSEISMSRSFDGGGFAYEEVFTRAEEAAFRQATIITVVSQIVRDSLVARGVDAGKILVNPNGADPAVYAPRAADEKRAVRAELGFTDDDRVIGFSGTFGGWHGIDVLAAAIPQICARESTARFLLIGDGSHKLLIDDAVKRNDLERRVRSVGRVPQSEGARLLGACDIYVSPHNSHMVDSRFFGSPTKLFEYMAMGGGIVGSDLEQLGEVLSPALRVSEFEAGPIAVTHQRSVLCTPGDVAEFTDAVTALVERPDVADALGRNARQAVLDRYSWQRHVENIWRSLGNGSLAHGSGPRRAPALDRLETGDAYKEEVQNQWNNNPVGPQYAKVTRPHTLEWFKEIEAHRYGEYGPWMPDVMEFDRHAGEDVLDIGGGIGTDLSQFARHGARVTDVDLSAGHLELAKENFALRGLTGRFVHHDAEQLPFDTNSFDLVYSNGVLHHTPNTNRVVAEIFRVLRPGGKAIVMMYAENSLHYWYRLVWGLGLRRGMLGRYSMGEIMSRSVEITENDAKPLVKVYTARRLANLFSAFERIEILKRQLTAPELPRPLAWLGADSAGRFMGWNLIIKARKPSHA